MEKKIILIGGLEELTKCIKKIEDVIMEFNISMQEDKPERKKKFKK